MLAVQGQLSKPFEYLLSHPQLGQRISQFASLIDAHPEVRSARDKPQSIRDIHCEVKVLQQDDGSRALDRFYWSLQRSDSSRPAGFAADTLVYSVKSGECRWLSFPEDSYLSQMPAWARDVAARPPDTTSVLRYVPLRRFTFRQRSGADELIGKIKRASRYKQAWNLLGVVADCVARAGTPFRVANPVRIEERHCLYFQSALPGKDMVGLIVDDNAVDLLGKVGEIHASLHRLSVAASLPRRSNAEWLSQAMDQISEINYFCPFLGGEVERLEARLRQAAPLDGVAAFCHGDFVCSQLLVDAGRWAITDFDLCHVGDPYRDMAMLMASLPYDVPGFSVRTYAEMHVAYLEGYRKQHSGPLDLKRLSWHSIAAEIYFMALSLRKGRYSESMFSSRLNRALDLAKQLADA